MITDDNIIEDGDNTDAMAFCSRESLVKLVNHAALRYGLKPVTVVSDTNAWIEFYEKDKCKEIFEKLIKHLDGTTLLKNYHEIKYDDLGAEEAHFICSDKRLYTSVVMIFCGHGDHGWSILLEVYSEKFVNEHQEQLTKIVDECPPYPI